MYERLFGRGHAPEGKTCCHWGPYSLTCYEYEELRSRANGQCEICEVPEDDVYGQLLVIDHCHKTGGPRGLICRRCNAVMACFDGNKRWGANRRWEEHAATYLEMSMLWSAYGQICERLGVSRIEDLTDHMERQVKAHGHSLG